MAVEGAQNLTFGCKRHFWRPFALERVKKENLVIDLTLDRAREKGEGWIPPPYIRSLFPILKRGSQWGGGFFAVMTL